MFALQKKANSLKNAIQKGNMTQKHLKSILILILFVLGKNTAIAQTTILDQTLLTQPSFNTFTAVSVIGAQIWYPNSLYGAVCNGYANAQSNENEDWLISPAMDLTQMNDVTLTFSHTRGSFSVVNVGVAEGWYKVYATADYTGDVVTTQWVEITGVNHSVPVAWQYISSGNLIFPETAKSATSRFAFKYRSSATQSATWEIKNVKVIGNPPANPNVSTFKITNWNTEWLGCTNYGPNDENLQLSNVASAMLAMNSDVYCIQEISNTTTNATLNALLAHLGTSTWDGSMVPGNTNDCDQRQAIIYKKNRVQLTNAALLNSGNAAQGNSYYYNWSSGRYPAVYTVNLLSGSNIVPITLVNIHSKAEDGDAMSYTRRLGSSEALKTILDGVNYNSKNVILIGDYNDLLIGTTSTACNCTNSPFKNYMDDTTNYKGLTQFLNDAYWNRPLIENFIISNELFGSYVMNSAAQEVAVAASISNYYNTTSDHLPVSTQFQFSTLSNPEYAFSTTNSLKIYPNPVTNELHFNEIDEINNDAIIFDLMGRQIHSDKINETTLNVAALPIGIYIIKVGNQSARFIKK